MAAEVKQTYEEQRGAVGATAITGPIDDPERQVFNALPITLTNGDFCIVDARGMKTMSVLCQTGGTVTWVRFSKGNSTDGALITNMPVVTAPTAGAITSIDVDWPFYKVSVAGGGAVVAVV